MLVLCAENIIRKTSWWARQDAKLVTSHVFGGCFKTAAHSLGILLLIIFLLIWPILVTRVNVTLEVSCIPKFMSVSWFSDFASWIVNQLYSKLLRDLNKWENMLHWKSKRSKIICEKNQRKYIKNNSQRSFSNSDEIIL